MPPVQLANVYNPLVFNSGVDEAAIELNAFLQSGVMVEDERLNQMASVGGNIGEMPFYGPLDTSGEPNYSTDNPASHSTPDGIDYKKEIYRLASMNNSWSTMDLARELALKDPLGAIIAKVGGWWATQIEKRVIQSAMGILADNIANDASDMLYKIATDDAADVTDAERISATAVVTAKQTMGDHFGAITAIAMHSVVFSRLQIQDLIVYVKNSTNTLSIPTYLGYRVIVDDSMPAESGVNRITYTTILFGSGVFGNGHGMIATPSELERVPTAGDGGGQDVIHSRKSEIIHPHGFQFTSANVAGQSATLAELATAANWDRIVARKKIPIVFLQTNG